MATKTINLRDLPEDLVRRAKAYAAFRGLTLKDFVIHAIEEAVQKDVPPRSFVSVLLGGEQRRRRLKGKK